jgi:HK97 family phage prohead protease
MPLADVHWQATADGEVRMSGYAAVFDRLSLDLGGFRERVARGAFDHVLKRDPDVLLLWDHDTKRVLAGTNNGSLELRSDSHGLRLEARVAPFSCANDLRLGMETGLIRQASFAFTGQDDDWDTGPGGTVTRTIRKVKDLFDVTVTAQGAYPETSAALARMRRRHPKGVSSVTTKERLASLQRYAAQRVRQEKLLAARTIADTSPPSPTPAVR